VVLARELGLCYVGVMVVTNKAAGLVGGKISHEEVLATMRRVGPSIDQFLGRLVSEADDDPACLCRQTE